MKNIVKLGLIKQLWMLRFTILLQPKKKKRKLSSVKIQEFKGLRIRNGTELRLTQSNKLKKGERGKKKHMRNNHIRKRSSKLQKIQKRSEERRHTILTATISKVSTCVAAESKKQRIATQHKVT